MSSSYYPRTSISGGPYRAPEHAYGGYRPPPRAISSATPVTVTPSRGPSTRVEQKYISPARPQMSPSSTSADTPRGLEEKFQKQLQLLLKGYKQCVTEHYHQRVTPAEMRRTAKLAHDKKLRARSQGAKSTSAPLRPVVTTSTIAAVPKRSQSKGKRSRSAAGPAPTRAVARYDPVAPGLQDRPLPKHITPQLHTCRYSVGGKCKSLPTQVNCAACNGYVSVKHLRLMNHRM